MKKRIVIFASLFAIMVIVILVFRITRNKQMDINDVKSKYDINKKLNELNIKNDKEYREYLKDISVHIEPKQLINYIDYDYYYYPLKNKLNIEWNGHDSIFALKRKAYENILSVLVQKEQDWSNLPLTEDFKKKFNEKDGVIKECDYNYKSISKYSYDNKTFSIEYDYIPDAHEKYTDDEIEFMLEYGAGAYNLDRYNYEFVLDDKGYLDDIIFLGITPVIVEGHNIEHSE